MSKPVSDRIIIKKIQAFCKLGTFDFERILGQVVNIDLELELDLKQAAKTDDVTFSIDYVEVSLAIRELAQSKDFLLIEHLTHEIINMLFKRFEKLEGVLIEVTKTIVNAEQFSGIPAIKLYRSRP